MAFIGAETLRRQDAMRRRAYHESGHIVAAIMFAIPIIASLSTPRRRTCSAVAISRRTMPDWKVPS
jgi:hypothetical protein